MVAAGTIMTGMATLIAVNWLNDRTEWEPASSRDAGFSIPSWQLPVRGNGYRFSVRSLEALALEHFAFKWTPVKRYNLL